MRNLNTKFLCKSLFLYVVLFFQFGITSAAEKVSLGLNAGSAYGNMRCTNSSTLESYFFQTNIDYVKPQKDGTKLTFGVVGNIATVFYDVDSEHKKGLFRGFGVSAGYRSIGFWNLDLTQTVSIYPISKMTVGSYSSIVINNENVDRFVLTEYQGSVGYSYNIALVKKHKGWPNFLKDKLLYGINLGIFHQGFNKKTDQISISNESLAPEEPKTSQTVNHSFNAITLGVQLYFWN